MKRESKMIKNKGNWVIYENETTLDDNTKRYSLTIGSKRNLGNGLSRETTINLNKDQLNDLVEVLKEYGEETGILVE